MKFVCKTQERKINPSLCVTIAYHKRLPFFVDTIVSTHEYLNSLLGLESRARITWSRARSVPHRLRVTVTTARPQRPWAGPVHRDSWEAINRAEGLNRRFFISFLLSAEVAPGRHSPFFLPPGPPSLPFRLPSKVIGVERSGLLSVSSGGAGATCCWSGY